MKASVEAGASEAGAGEQAVCRVLLLMVRSIVDRPDDVKIGWHSVPEGIVLRVRASRGDLEKLAGPNARALQVIVSSCGMKFGRRFHVEMAGEERS